MVRSVWVPVGMSEFATSRALATERAPEIEFRDVHTRWTPGRDWPGTRTRPEALSGLWVRLPAGQISVLMGDHGSGKSLLALHLLGELAPDHGQVLVGGQSLWELPEYARRELHDRFGLFRGGTAMRESELVATATVRENLTDLLTQIDGVPAPARVPEWLDCFDLTELADELPDKLASPARRRLALALALAHDPPVVVIDDPAQAIDFTHADDMIGSVSRWHARTGATVLITVHSLRVARELAHQVVVLRDGHVAAQGPPERVLEGVIDDEGFTRRFGSDIGGVAESDPERIRRLLRRLNLRERRVQLALTVVFLLIGVLIVALLVSGIIHNPLVSASTTGSLIPLALHGITGPGR